MNEFTLPAAKFANDAATAAALFTEDAQFQVNETSTWKGPQEIQTGLAQKLAEFKGMHAGEANALSDDERSEFVRTHLTLIATAAAARLKDDPGAETVAIETGQLRREDASRAPDRRNSGDRRKGDRRKADRGPPGTERRRS